MAPRPQAQKLAAIAPPQTRPNRRPDPPDPKATRPSPHHPNIFCLSRWLFLSVAAAAVFRSFCPPVFRYFCPPFFLHFSILSNWDLVHPEAKGWKTRSGSHTYRATFFLPRRLCFFADHAAAAVFRSFCPPFLGLFALRYYTVVFQRPLTSSVEQNISEQHGRQGERALDCRLQ